MREGQRCLDAFGRLQVFPKPIDHPWCPSQADLRRCFQPLPPLFFPSDPAPRSPAKREPSCRSIWFVIIACIKIAFIAFTAQAPAIYASTAPISALLQQVNGESPLIQPIKLKPKKLITAMLTAIDRTCNGIITSYCVLRISYCVYLSCDTSLSNRSKLLFSWLCRCSARGGLDGYRFYRFHFGSKHDFVISHDGQQRDCA